jgi:sugar phosphate isomerase/epimerase
VYYGPTTKPPIQQRRNSALKLGIDTSLIYQGFDVFQALDFAASIGAESAILGRGQLKGFDPDHLQKVRAHADNLGLSLEMGIGCIDRHSSNFKPALGAAAEQLTEAIHAAQILGSTKVLCHIGNLHNRLHHGPFEQRLKDAGEAVTSIKPLIEATGIRVAIENHGDATARELAALIEDIGPQYAGVCLDSGNPVAIAEDPLLAVEVLAPYALMTAFRDSLVWRVPDGAMAQWVPMGAGNTDLPAMVRVLQQHAPDVAFSLELIVGGAPKPVPYLDPDSELWQKVGHTPARDFARFVALAEKGPAGPVEVVWRPESGSPSAELHAQLKEQQRRVLAEGLSYCREALGLGERHPAAAGA